LLFPFCIHASRFDTYYNKYSSEKITDFVVLGERSSGTKFLSVLIKDNFEVENVNRESMHKHFIPWLNVSPRSKIDHNQLTFAESKSFFKNTSDVLFIFIVRNPYDWLRSFYNHGWHVPSEIKLCFSSFISETWASTEYEVDDYNPWTQRPFENVLELRKYKTLNFLNVNHFVKNFVFVSYEDLCDDQKGFIQFVAKKFNIKKKKNTVVEDQFIGRDPSRVNKTFTKPKYFVPTEEEVSFINKNLSWDFERSLGYSKLSYQDLINENE